MAPVARAPVVALAAGWMLYVGPLVYVELARQGDPRQLEWRMIAFATAFWAGAAWLLIAGVSWARETLRGLSVLIVIAGLYYVWRGSSTLSMVVHGLRVLVFAALFALLGAPPAHERR